MTKSEMVVICSNTDHADNKDAANSRNKHRSTHLGPLARFIRRAAVDAGTWPFVFLIETFAVDLVFCVESSQGCRRFKPGFAMGLGAAVIEPTLGVIYDSATEVAPHQVQARKAGIRLWPNATFLNSVGVWSYAIAFSCICKRTHVHGHSGAGCRETVDV